jgi:hypothetical protein
MLGTNFKELSRKINNITENIVVGLDTQIINTHAKPREKNKEMLSFDEIGEKMLFKNPAEVITRTKRRKKKIRLTMPERYKPRYDLAGIDHPLVIAWKSLEEEVKQELFKQGLSEKEASDLIGRSTRRDQGDDAHQTNNTTT